MNSWREQEAVLFGAELAHFCLDPDDQYFVGVKLRGYLYLYNHLKHGNI